MANSASRSSARSARNPTASAPSAARIRRSRTCSSPPRAAAGTSSPATCARNNMKHFFTLLSHEIRMLLVSPSTYLAAVLFLAFMGFIFTTILELFSKAPQEMSPAQYFFDLFWLPVLFMVPMLTMKCLAEERRLGTIETLLTTPVTTTEVVLGKYGAAYLLYVALWGSTG